MRQFQAIPGLHQDPPIDNENTPGDMAERDKGRVGWISPNSRMEKKFDTMMDMMSQLLGKIGQFIAVKTHT